MLEILLAVPARRADGSNAVMTGATVGCKRIRLESVLCNSLEFCT